MGLNGINTYETAEQAGLATYGTYSGTNKQCVQSLIDLIQPEHTQNHRGLLDQMSPTARAQLLVELKALLAAVENV